MSPRTGTEGGPGQDRPQVGFDPGENFMTLRFPAPLAALLPACAGGAVAVLRRRS
ncbi:hypothetical protein [Mangrovicoccus algicola]|uniref:Uncharacterized protein n=1 Tax=Mangrovicoccus algicola TaxID=2771008 RepID=A0A8J6YX25_9RHOB|nr:hypothetical protein [Mangrovicoccus algicola]MBE3639317.1 hypothetical protein [Mangrovicoccus algicola]